MNTSDVIVVGAGIGGAVLALALGARGWKVKVLEREAQPIPMSRPEILWGPTINVLGRLGVGDLVCSQASVQLDGVEFTRGNRRLLSLSRDVFNRANVEAYSTDPGLTRELIAAAAVATGNVTIQRGFQVQQVVREGARVVGVQGNQGQNAAQFVEHARLIVGDDGADSVVRAAITDLRLATFPLDFVVAAIDWPDELPGDRVRGWLYPPGFRAGIPAVACFPWPGGRGVLLLPMPHTRAVSLLAGAAEMFWTELAQVTPLAAALSKQLRFPDSFRRVQRPYGHSPKYVVDGAAIIGDAAHPMSPAGGQGANASIWDAVALAEAADEALTADDLSRQRLVRYERLRHLRNSNSVRITERAVRAFRVGRYVPAMQLSFPAALRCLDSSLALKSRLVSAIATTFVTR